MGRTMLKDSKLDGKFWVQAIDTEVFIINRSLLKNNYNNNPYELWKGKPNNVKYFRIFRSKCYIKKIKIKVYQMDVKSAFLNGELE